MERNNEKKQKVRLIDVPSNSVGQRLDNFLVRELKGVPKSLVYRLVRQGQVRVNGGRCKPEYKLKGGDKVRIPPLRLATCRATTVPTHWLDLIRNSVLFENDQLLVIDKPCGLPVHRGTGVEYGLVDILKHLRPSSNHWELAHRLDKDTSGCLVVAKSRVAKNGIQDCFRGGKVDKRYLALTQGQWQSGIQTVNAPLAKNVTEGGERMVKVRREGKHATSHFKVIEEYRVATLVEVAIETGRTHQIRVHARYADHPVAGDSRYGDREFNKLSRKFGLKRLFLHACAISFVLGGEEINISSRLPTELSDVLKLLPSH